MTYLVQKRREKELPGLHLRLLQGWNALPKLDSYAWRWVSYHLAQAGRKDDLRQLLLNFEYLAAKLAATDTNALIADYDYLPADKDLSTVQVILRHSLHILAVFPRDLAQWSPRGFRLPGQHPARLGPGDGANQNDAPWPYRLSKWRGNHTRWSPRDL
jgi:apoptotic protease-activating factor 1-like protein